MPNFTDGGKRVACFPLTRIVDLPSLQVGNQHNEQHPTTSKLLPDRSFGEELPALLSPPPPESPHPRVSRGSPEAGTLHRIPPGCEKLPKSRSQAAPCTPRVQPSQIWDSFYFIQFISLTCVYAGLTLTWRKGSLKTMALGTSVRLWYPLYSWTTWRKGATLRSTLMWFIKSKCSGTNEYGCHHYIRSPNSKY